MALLTYVVFVRDSASSPPGQPATGLKPTWAMLRRLKDGSDIKPQPAITEIGNGHYKWSYDPNTNPRDMTWPDEASGQIDFGPTLTSLDDRLRDVVMYAADSNIETLRLVGSAFLTNG